MSDETELAPAVLRACGPRLRGEQRPFTLNSLRLVVILLASIQAFSASAAASASNLPHRISVAGHIMVPVACGVRQTLWIDHYVAALYLSPGAKISVLRNPSQPKAVLIRMVETRYLPERIPGKWLDALEREVPAARLEPVRRAYHALATGDLVRLEYVPRRSVTMRLNGRLVARLPGQRIVDAILTTWADGENVEHKLDELIQSQRC